MYTRNKQGKTIKSRIPKNKKEMKTYSLEELTDVYIGKFGTPKREHFEQELRLELIGDAIRKERKSKYFSKDQNRNANSRRCIR